MTQSYHYSNLPVAIQGYEGSFHQEAARRFFGKKVAVQPCDTFRQLVQMVASPIQIRAGVMAIENSIAGSILPNYTLLQRHPLVIIGEVYLHIRQHLLVNPGVEIEDLKEVHSHPMALLQCMQYLEQFPQLKLVESDDTALSAKHIQQKRSKHQAAIASKLAADLYGLQILASNIHTMKPNYTRFLVVAPIKNSTPIDGADKASVRFQTDHSKGSLAAALTQIAKEGVNISKLQSMPIPGTDFKYAFHADLEFDDPKQLSNVRNYFEKTTSNFTVFGVYKNGR